ncbi:outer membrane protein assembly factor BamE [Novosphingobium sp. TH158]|uniref:outer membrane protein assembly factor BamE n=1 Tax=Novosphingobium sp. TH158 TaxID=2067455 RepID=UPI000C7CDA64|nr:outer membrane protein assembly factor BamE [Novosphingobium sp. TH158]PLK26607.1 outer membrane protein assembly factor BamE [Novosphingobium sp. TH158]
MRHFRHLRAGVAALVAVAALSGCASIKDHRGYLADNALVDAVQPGIDNKLSVERALGRPTFVSEWGRKDWFYVSVDTKQAAFTRPRSYEQTILRVSFDDTGNVSGVEKIGMDKVVRLDPDGNKTPTLGRERGFLEDLFGNIGTVGTGMGGPAGGAPGTGPNGS